MNNRLDRMSEQQGKMIEQIDELRQSQIQTNTAINQLTNALLQYIDPTAKNTIVTIAGCGS